MHLDTNEKKSRLFLTNVSKNQSSQKDGIRRKEIEIWKRMKHLDMAKMCIHVHKHGAMHQGRRAKYVNQWEGERARLEVIVC